MNTPISNFEGILIAFSFIVLLGFYNGILILDDRTSEDDPRNKELEMQWHGIGAGLFVLIAYTLARTVGWTYVPFVLSGFWLLYAGIVHIVGLNMPFFYVGTTAFTDKFIRKIASFIKTDERKTSAILKCAFFAASLLLILIVKTK